VDFRLHYEFSSRMLERLVGPVFNYIAGSFIDAFVKRAERLYGED
jgi:ribosome-associated toxin RatA of RatAB toxin-antitoxin module